ncbi:MAG: hypothetical protein COA96_12175 [SAR86 cluster bacterium]|uniref:DUF1499 domain-containing protein n=1 Tax=SAR86 cluster bacterium TaxID=2030880 RepID=A0A2A5AW27_9GAMM|nr:MAG: hypothetical protein COA96_12175 [SAR86 cluster bacterium]
MNSEISDNKQNKFKLYLKIVAMVIMLTGMGIGLLTLGSAAGIWLGLWDFRKGFELLRISNSYSDIVAWVGLVTTIAIVIAAKLLNTGNAVRLGSLAAAGTVVAAIAYSVPESFRPAEGVNFPPIHDISTNLTSPPNFVDVLPLRIDAANTVVYGGSNNMTPERLAELTSEAYPDLIPRRYAASVDEVFELALAAVNSLGWEVVAAAKDEGRIEATDTTFWFRFKDDIVIIIETEGNQTLVNARSVSRVGTGDVGANAIRLRAFFELL